MSFYSVHFYSSKISQYLFPGIIYLAFVIHLLINSKILCFFFLLQRARQWLSGTWMIVRSLMVWMLLLSGRTLTLPFGNRGLRVESISPLLVIFARLRPQKTFPVRIKIFHCPKMEERETRRTKILAYFLCQATGNDYGSNFLLIIEDISKRFGFVSVFRYLKSKRIYKVLLAQPVVPDFKLLGPINLVWL